ncbi:MAG TPA: ATP-binding protein, partial [Dongiaceae bacterium]|nr:ATP-binding protein [Dongiaceae bacterium]
LITNATKHAYPGSAEQRVWVKLEAGTDGMIVLAVRDEGQGLPADFRLEHSTGTGMRLVRAIAQQLNATIEVHRRRGTEFLVSIPADRAG